MSDFVKEIHNMFDHIWDCEIDHPVYQDTVGELMEGVIQAYEKHKPTLSTNLAEVGTDCISRQAAIDVADAVWSVTGDKNVAKVWAQIKDLPSVQPEIIYCKDCKHYHRDNSGLYYCGRKDYGYGWGLNDFCSDAERRTDD